MGGLFGEFILVQGTFGLVVKMPCGQDRDNAFLLQSDTEAESLWRKKGLWTCK